MHRIFTVLLVTGALATLVATPGCTADVHDNSLTANVNLDQANVNMTATSSVSNVAPASSVEFNVTLDSGVYLCDPSQTPPADQASVAAYFEVFLDSESSTPLVTTASTTVSVTIPSSTPPGNHNVICRLHHHDGTPTQSVTQVSITVSASAGTADAG